MCSLSASFLASVVLSFVSVFDPAIVLNIMASVIGRANNKSNNKAPLRDARSVKGLRVLTPAVVSSKSCL